MGVGVLAFCTPGTGALRRSGALLRRAGGSTTYMTSTLAENGVEWYWRTLAGTSLSAPGRAAPVTTITQPSVSCLSAQPDRAVPFRQRQRGEQ